MEEKKLKLIWDFKGPDAAKIAEHHVIHLNQFIDRENYPIKITGTENVHEMHSTAFMVVNQSTMIEIRDALKPHRGEWYE
ncbi:hypothetical protein K5I29_07975 [Flavobacterium agricola]|uniref:Uncharacterized protein n=1 Tax=Flavobacterium agricola TaxID=2870839 RepID=A0ABY6LYL5_9FLAO|nr:hypothetical protein [Flavobacterium agricola]UYW00489.1 hypothetical protein K5I29_07975 [Flavobacterium agricola]